MSKIDLLFPYLMALMYTNKKKKTYSLHKYVNLVKPFMIVSCDGHIIDVVGPYAATQTDAEIINHLFEAEDNRGFRDAISLLQRLGYQIHKPESPDHGQTQLSTEQANKSRKVTLCRWVVEVVNGRFKRDFKLFRQRFFNLATPHLIDDFKIAAVLINKYHILIEDRPNSDKIIQRVVRFMDQPNSLGIFVFQMASRSRKQIELATGVAQIDNTQDEGEP
uniref:SFRICE_038592 n=1 Tax=Spodoptera frugiperda TaxID=7108 RepID=A0A2H1VI49_SPOFR